MSGFKDIVSADNKKVFMNTDEFADARTVVYDGVTYSDIPIVLIDVKEGDRPVQTVSDHAQGLYRVTAVLHVALPDLGGVVPEKLQKIKVSDSDGSGFFQEYYVASSGCEMGMIRAELEATGE